MPYCIAHNNQKLVLVNYAKKQKEKVCDSTFSPTMKSSICRSDGTPDRLLDERADCVCSDNAREEADRVLAENGRHDILS